jgi:transposase
MVLGERVDEARCSMKGRKQTNSCSPGGRSCSSPIQEATLGVFVFEIIRAMELTTILNHCHRHRGFVYQHARFSPDKKSIEVNLRPRRGAAAVCSGCHRPAPGYDHLPGRRFEFIPFWGILVFFLYQMRRVHCGKCGVVVEEVPWSDGKHQSTKAHMLFLARWARKLSWKETAESFHTSWDKVCDAVEYVVGYGLDHRTLESIKAIGVDEIQYAKGHKYLTLVYQIDQGFTRLLWVGKERTPPCQHT